jgi:hypothetical protein
MAGVTALYIRGNCRRRVGAERQACLYLSTWVPDVNRNRSSDCAHAPIG